MILIYFTSLILGALGAIVISRFGAQVGLLDLPGSRSSHTKPVPKGGGIGILAAFILVSLIIGIPVMFWLPAGITALLGLYGDKVDLSPKLRLVVQFSAATAIIVSQASFQANPLFWLFFLSFWTVFIVGTANFYNFMDGIDGLAAFTGFIAFGLLAIYLLLNDLSGSLLAVCACLSLSCLAFLPFNIFNARVFMGDTGSVFLGFVFAVLVFVLSKNILDLVSYAALLFPFYIDALTTIVVRFQKGENLSRAHRRHLYQLLANEKKIAHWKITLGYGVVQLLVGSIVFLLKPAGITTVLLFLGFCSLVFILVSYRIRNMIERLVRRG